MKRFDALLLLLLAGSGWGATFALVGLCAFASVPDNGPLALVFGGFGFAAGAGVAGLRLWLEARLPTTMAAALRPRPAAAAPTAEAQAEAPFVRSAFGG